MTTRDKAIEDVRWAMGFLSYVGAGASSDTWDQVRDRARQHARELDGAIRALEADDEVPAPPARDNAYAVYSDVRTYLGAKAPALAERFELAFLHEDAGMREVQPCRCDCTETAELVEGRAAGVDLAAIARELLPGGHLSLTIYGPPDHGGPTR